MRIKALARGEPSKSAAHGPGFAMLCGNPSNSADQGPGLAMSCGHQINSADQCPGLGKAKRNTHAILQIKAKARPR